MNPIRINIPNRVPLDTVAAAGSIVLDALREAGIEPRSRAAQSNPMLAALLSEWGRGVMTRDRFIHACKNLLVLNPALGKG